MSELVAALVGGFFGGVLGVASTLVASYYGPRWLEQWRWDREEQRNYGPRKQLPKEMLAEPNPPIRTFERLTLATGTTDEECKRLLVEIGARGVLMRGGRQGWALIERYPLNQPPVIDMDADDD